MSDILIEIAELIYPDDFDKQTELMGAIVNGGMSHERLPVLTAANFRAYYEQHGKVPLEPETHLEDIFNLLGRKI